MAHQTLDQRRAAFAWQEVTKASDQASDQKRRDPFVFKDFKNLSKGAPALIMGNGLMPALAFWESRKKPPATFLSATIRSWLVVRYASDAALKPLTPPMMSYPELMQRLLVAPSSFYMAATDETLSMLRWLRQFADALDSASGVASTAGDH